MDVPLNRKQLDYIDEQIRSGRAGSQEEVLREGLQLLMERDAEERRKYEAWREETRRNIEIGYQQLLAGDTVDGEEFLEELRLELEARRESSR